MRPELHLNTSIVRIKDTHNISIGMGFLFDTRMIITCAHVVSRALNYRLVPSDPPKTNLLLDFPLLDANKSFPAKVVLWVPPDIDGSGDIACLELCNDVTIGTQPATLLDFDELWGRGIVVFGFPDGYENIGVWASGIVRAKLANNWLQVDPKEDSAYSIQPGFSGGPAWDVELGEVIGMVVAADMRPDSRVAFLIPTRVIAEIEPRIKNNVNTDITRKIINVVENLLEINAYAEAYRHCQQTLINYPSHPELNLLAAIALMRGQGADKLHERTIVRVEKHLQIAQEGLTTKFTALAILGIIKYDFYVINGLYEGLPSLDELRLWLQDINIQSLDQRLKLVKASNGALKFLGL